MKIIDVHTHLGNILEPNGRELIYQENASKGREKDPIDLNEKMLMRHFGLGKLMYRLNSEKYTLASIARNMTATLANMRKSMTENQVSFNVCMPIAPYLTFEDLAKAAEVEPKIIPFTSIDFTKNYDVGQKLKNDVSRGAKGLKLHPIIQCQPVSGRPTMEALQSFEPLKKPVLVHTGKTSYYSKTVSHRNRPKNGEVQEIVGMVRTFPNIRFIIGHAGIFWANEVIYHLSDCKNVWLDTSFQSPGMVKKIVRTFGLDKVMFASDWPWGNQAPPIRIVNIACKGDLEMAERIFFRNAEELLELETKEY